MRNWIRRIFSGAVATILAFSLAVPAFAATSVSEFKDEDYLTLHPKDYYMLRDYTIGGKGVSWKEGAQVIYGETSMYGGIPTATSDGVWTLSPHYDSSVTEIDFPDSVVILGYQLFDNREEITSVNFEELTNLKSMSST